MRFFCLTVLLAVALTLPLWALPLDADAGEYQVHVCDTSWSPPANDAFAAQADAGMTAYSDCPAGQGIVVRNAFDGGVTPSGNGAYYIFDAPPGTKVASLDFDGGAERHDCGYSMMLVAGGNDMGGTRVWGEAAGQNCSGSMSPGPTGYFPVRWSVPVNADRVRAQVRCASGSTCRRDGVTAVRLRNVVVKIQDDAGPTLARGRGGLWDTGARWIRGTLPLGFDATDGSGVSAMSINVDGREVVSKSFPCVYTRPAPCAASPSWDQQIATSGFGGDGAHQVTLIANDAAGNASSATQQVLVDNTAPDPPSAVTLEGGMAGERRTRSPSAGPTRPRPARLSPAHCGRSAPLRATPPTARPVRVMGTASPRSPI